MASHSGRSHPSISKMTCQPMAHHAATVSSASQGSGARRRGGASPRAPSLVAGPTRHRSRPDRRCIPPVRSVRSPPAVHGPAVSVPWPRLPRPRCARCRAACARSCSPAPVVVRLDHGGFRVGNRLSWCGCACRSSRQRLKLRPAVVCRRHVVAPAPRLDATHSGIRLSAPVAQPALWRLPNGDAGVTLGQATIARRGNHRPQLSVARSLRGDDGCPDRPAQVLARAASL